MYDFLVNGMKKWNGNFKESKYVETGNIVNNVIENNGRLLHEETVDGYTHEITDRGSYISDDYYFPQRETGRKPHIHYEIRSNGEILKDGKSIKQKRNGGNRIMGVFHGKQLSRNKGLDGTIIKGATDNLIGENSKLHELGQKLVSDKNKLENEIENVQNSKFSDDKKKVIIEGLEEAIGIVQEQYEQDVANEELKIQAEIEEQTELMQEGADEWQQQVDSLKAVKLDEAQTDISAVVSEADAQKETFEQMKNEYIEKLNLQIEQLQIQQRMMRARKISGKK